MSPMVFASNRKGLITGSPNISAKSAAWRVSSVSIAARRRRRRAAAASRIAAIRRCSGKGGRGMCIPSTIRFEISLNVAPLPFDWRRAVFAFSQ